MAKAERRWNIWKARSWFLGAYPWMVDCPLIPTITEDPSGALATKHLRSCVACDRFPSFDSARRYVADRISEACRVPKVKP